MKINFPDEIKCTCVKCAHKCSYQSNDFHIDEEYIARDMTVEVEHVFSMIKNCVECGHQHIISISAFEYPEGIFNTVHNNIHGVILKDKSTDFFEDS